MQARVRPNKVSKMSGEIYGLWQNEQQIKRNFKIYKAVNWVTESTLDSVLIFLFEQHTNIFILKAGQLRLVRYNWFGQIQSEVF